MSGITVTSTTDSLADMHEALGMPAPADAGSDATTVNSEDTPRDANVAPKAPVVEEPVADEPTEAVLSDEKAETEPEKVPDNETPAEKQARQARHASAQKRISEINQKWRDEQMKSRELAARLDAMEKAMAAFGHKPEPAKPTDVTTPPADADAEPSEDAFENWGDYHKALVKFNAKQEAKALFAEREKTERQQSAQTAFQTAQKQFETAEADVRTAHEDYDEVVAASQIPIAASSPEAQALNQMILTSVDANGAPLGPSILYHLATHPDEAAGFKGLTQAALVRYFGRIEARVEAQTAAGVKPAAAASKPASPVTRAAAPVKPVAGARAAVTANSDDDNLSFAEWEQRREAEIKARGRR